MFFFLKFAGLSWVVRSYFLNIKFGLFYGGRRIGNINKVLTLICGYWILWLWRIWRQNEMSGFWNIPVSSPAPEIMSRLICSHFDSFNLNAVVSRLAVIFTSNKSVLLQIPRKVAGHSLDRIWDCYDDSSTVLDITIAITAILIVFPLNTSSQLLPAMLCTHLKQKWSILCSRLHSPFVSFDCDNSAVGYLHFSLSLIGNNQESGGLSSKLAPHHTQPQHEMLKAFKSALIREH